MMLVFPIVVKPLTDTFQQAWILLERNGTHAISVESVGEATEFAAENGLALRRPAWASDDIIFLDILPTAALQDFYTWSEVTPGQQPMREAWRPFLWAAADPQLGVAKGLREICLGPDEVRHSVAALLEGFFSIAPAPSK